MNILTFDIEDWWVYEYYKLGNSSDYLPRLNWYLNEILDLLDERGFKATFFCLGEVANKYPNIIKLIAEREHHIGCHSYSHRFWGTAKPKEVEEDTRIALDVIENIIGKKVTAYRAPAFSISEKNKWILGILAENGIKYDCSIFPANRRFGGFTNFSQSIPSVIDYQGIKVREFPMSITKVWGKEVAYSGGGYFRLFPYSKIKAIVEKSGYVMTYFHIKDFDKDQKQRYASFQGESAPINFFKSYYGLKGNFSKFKKFISDFEFVSVKQTAELVNWDEAPLITI